MSECSGADVRTQNQHTRAHARPQPHAHKRTRCVAPGWSVSSLPSTSSVRARCSARRCVRLSARALPLSTQTRPSSRTAPVVAVYVFSQPSVHEFIFANVRACPVFARCGARRRAASPATVLLSRSRVARFLVSGAALASSSGGTFSSRRTRTRILRPRLPRFGASAPPRRLLPQQEQNRQQHSSTGSKYVAARAQCVATMSVFAIMEGSQ